MKEFEVKDGNNIPIQCPMFLNPLVPYECKNQPTLFAVCQGDEAIIRKYLSPTPFEYVSDIFLIAISDSKKRVCLNFPDEKRPVMDCSLIFQVKYKGIRGGYTMFEYEDYDYAIAAGRDLWAYPKKYGKIIFSKKGQKVKGVVIKEGKTIVQIETDLSKPVKNLPKLTTYPHLNIQILLEPDGKIFTKRIISRDTSPDYELISEECGETTVFLDGVIEKLPLDPLHELMPKKVLGGGVKVGNFLASEKNGWGKVIDTLI
jgi:acetoacetate decarboxylase